MASHLARLLATALSWRMEIQHAPKYRPQMGMAMRIMDHGSGSGLAMAMKVKMATTVQC